MLNTLSDNISKISRNLLTQIFLTLLKKLIPYRPTHMENRLVTGNQQSPNCGLKTSFQHEAY